MNNSTRTNAVEVAKMSSSEPTPGPPTLFVGIDVSDRKSRYCILGAGDDAIVREGQIPTTVAGLERLLGKLESACVAIEVGTHSAWISRCVDKLGHEVVVANARKLRAIYESNKKNDKLDAQMLARLVRADRALLSPLEHRGGQAQCDLAVIRARDELVRTRTQLVNSCRGTLKAFGGRLPRCSTKSFHTRVAKEIPAYLMPALSSLIELIGELTNRICEYDSQLQVISKRYPAVEQLRQIAGVGPVTALAFVLTVEDPERFKSPRSIGAYFGLVPKLDDSGDKRSQLRISKAGDSDMRRLLVQCGHYILGPFGPDCDLRRHGERIATRGGKNAKKRAAVAVARKLSVLLLVLWQKGTSYEPLRQADRQLKAS